ncbi:hypothetical protein SDC9_112817 [bioreactor metagenome]|uniref:Uncharacterized protein n=1 Tax=bioreactor metagenome TaxID=1076179 RepID=A0A645BRQ9_9ZZZZ
MAEPDQTGPLHRRTVDRIDEVAQQLAGRRRGPSGRVLGPHQSPDVGEHRARLHRGELVGVADEQQPGVRPGGLQQPGHQRQRDHRHLVHHDQVVRQRPQTVVREPRRAVAPPAQQPVDRGGVQPPEPVHHLRIDLPHRGQGVLDRLAHPGGRLAGRGGQADVQVRLQRRQDDQDPGDRRGLAGAGATLQDAQPGGHRRRGSGQLVVRFIRREPCRALDPREHRSQHRGDPVPVGADHRGAAPDIDVGPDQLLVAPVAVEIEQGADQPQRPAGRPVGADTDQGTVAQTRQPAVQVGPVERRHVDGALVALEDRLPYCRQVDAHRPGPDRADHQCDRERDPRIGRPAEECQLLGGLDVGETEHPRGIEVGHQAGSDDAGRAGPGDDAGRAGRGGPGRAGASDARRAGPDDAGHGVDLPSVIRSAISTTNPAGGRQANTP